MILLLALLAGLLGGLSLALLQKRAWQVPQLRITWLAVVAFLPQVIAFYLPATRVKMPNVAAAISLIASQVLLLVFCWFNRQLAGVWLLAVGLVLNLTVIAVNGGFMPISPQVASRLVPADVMASLSPGTRFGYGKDILLSPEHTNLAWLSDRFLTPTWFRYRVAFSIGDIFIAVGAFWLLLTQGKPLLKTTSEE